MHVLVVAASPPWLETDGASLVLRHQLAHLAARHEITVLAAGRPQDALEPGADAVPAGATARWFGPSRRGTTAYARRRLQSLATREPAQIFSVELPDLVDAFDVAVREAPDVVHLHGWGTARLSSRFAGPVVHAVLDSWQRGYGEQRAIPRWRRAVEAGQRRKVRRHERLHYPRCDAVVVVAPPEADVIRATAPTARVEVIPNGVEVGVGVVPAATDPVLGFHGVLSTVANETAALTLVTDVLPLVRARHPHATALVAGKDPGPALRRLRGGEVDVPGYVPDMGATLARVAVYVAPLTRGSGIKNKVLEAMAAGLPVVATPMALDGIGAAGGVVVADDPAGVAARVADLLDDPAERHRLGALNLARAKELSWQGNADALDRLWNDVVARRSSGPGTGGSP